MARKPNKTRIKAKYIASELLKTNKLGGVTRRNITKLKRILSKKTISSRPTRTINKIYDLLDKHIIDTVEKRNILRRAIYNEKKLKRILPVKHRITVSDETYEKLMTIKGEEVEEFKNEEEILIFLINRSYKLWNKHEE